MINNNFKNNVLGVRIDNLSYAEIIKKIKKFLTDSDFHQIVTVNPEFVLEAQKNYPFKQILNQSNLNIADGVGIKLAFYYLGIKLKQRLAGVDLMIEILKIASVKKIPLFLVINQEGLSSFKEIRSAILRLYPQLKINGITISKKTDLSLYKKLSFSLPTILFCNLGAPDQEFFINFQKNANIKLAMGVGGSFDFLTGKVKRAPIFMRQIGLEWFWRIFQQKQNRWKRIERILRAVLVFPFQVISKK